MYRDLFSSSISLSDSDTDVEHRLNSAQYTVIFFCWEEGGLLAVYTLSGQRSNTHHRLR
jgi:hypothetical protein